MAGDEAAGAKVVIGSPDDGDGPEVAPAPQAVSLRDQLRASRKRSQNRQHEAFVIPGYDPPLQGTFKALDDYTEVRAIVLAHQAVSDDAERELLVAADTLARSCLEIYPVVDGSRAAFEIPTQGFTPELAAYLVVDDNDQPVQVDNARQAVLAIFPNTLAIMTVFAEVDAWFKTAGAKSDEDLAGNSVAPS